MCQYCEGDSVKYQESRYSDLYINSFGKAKHLVVEINVCPPYADCSVKNMIRRSAFQINFCPNCGADLRF